MKASMRRLVARAAVLAIGWTTLLPAGAGDYLFFGTSRPRMASWRDCQRWTYETKEFDSEADAKAYLRAFLRDPTHGDHAVDLFPARVNVLIYRYPGTTPANRDCVVEKYGAVSSPTREGALARMEENARTYKDYYAGPPQVAQTWGGSGETGATSADRLEERDIVAGRSGKATVVAKVRNRSPDKTAFVTYIVDGKRLPTVELPPGSVLTLPLGKGVEGWQRRVKFVPRKAKGKPLDAQLLDSAKETVRDYVIRKGTVEPSGSKWSGVRG